MLITILFYSGSLAAEDAPSKINVYAICILLKSLSAVVTQQLHSPIIGWVSCMVDQISRSSDRTSKLSGNHIEICRTSRNETSHGYHLRTIHDESFIGTLACNNSVEYCRVDCPLQHDGIVQSSCQKSKSAAAVLVPLVHASKSCRTGSMAHRQRTLWTEGAQGFVA